MEEKNYHRLGIFSLFKINKAELGEICKLISMQIKSV